MLERVPATTVKWASIDERGTLTSLEVQQVYQKKPKFGGGQIKWYKDRVRADKVKEGQR